MTVITPIRAVLTAGTTQATFVARTVMTTEPTGGNVINLATNDWGHGINVPDRLKVIPVGGTTENQTFDMRIWGWNKLATTNHYVPTFLVHVSATVGSVPIAALGAGAMIVDTLLLVAGTSNVDVLHSPANNTPAYAIIKVQGCQYMDFDWDMTGATNGNALVSPVEAP